MTYTIDPAAHRAAQQQRIRSELEQMGPQLPRIDSRRINSVRGYLEYLAVNGEILAYVTDIYDPGRLYTGYSLDGGCELSSLRLYEVKEALFAYLGA